MNSIDRPIRKSAADEPVDIQDREASLEQGDHLELKIWLRLLTCTTMIEQVVRQRLREGFDVTLPRFDLLAQLDRAPDGLMMGDLSRRLMVSHGNVTNLIDRLVEDGWVERHAVPGDRRAQLVRLTRLGKEKFDTMTPEHQRWVVDLFSKVPRKDLKALQDLLGGLKSSIQEGSKE
jgi:DNA-binding MarR family transcriptional regulator